MKLLVALAFILMASYGGRMPASGSIYGGRFPVSGLYGGRLPPYGNVPFSYPYYNREYTPYDVDDYPSPKYVPEYMRYFSRFGKYVPKYLLEKWGDESDMKKVVDYKKKVVPVVTSDPEAPEVDVNVKVPDVYGLLEKRTDVKLIPTSHYIPTHTPQEYPGYPFNPEHTYGSPYPSSYKYPIGYPPYYKYPSIFNPTVMTHPLLRYISEYPNRYPVNIPESYNSMSYFYKYMPEMYKYMPEMYKYMPEMYRYMPEMYKYMPEMYKYMPNFNKYMPTISKYFPEMYKYTTFPGSYKFEILKNIPELFKTYTDFYKYVPEVFKYYPDIYKYMPESYSKYFGHPEVPEVVYKYVYDLMKRYNPDMYSKYIPEMFRTYYPEIYSKYTPEILDKYNPEVHTNLRHYITSILEHPEIEELKKDVLRSYIFRHIFTTPYKFLHETIYSPEYELVRYLNKIYTPLSYEGYPNEI